jgi:hypothetical protein
MGEWTCGMTVAVVPTGRPIFAAWQARPAGGGYRPAGLAGVAHTKPNIV